MNPILSIAVISDTHNHVPEALPQILSEADEIWHLGDVCSPEVLSSIEALGKPMSVVQGNMDVPFTWRERILNERHGHRFFLQHYPPSRPESDVDAILHGHLHVPVNDRLEGTKVLSPGAITGPRNDSTAGFAWLRFYEESSWTWDRVEL
ncbi:MAG: metallophosphoesterase family protein [Verrucomicrobiota bacterium]